MLWCCMWERGQRWNSATGSSVTLLSVSSTTSCKKLMPFQLLPWCLFPSGWACVISRTPWAPQMDSHERLAVSSTTTIPTGFYRGYEALFPNAGTLGCVVCPGAGIAQPPVVPPGFYLHMNVGLPGLPATTTSHVCPLCPGCLSLPLLPV